MTPKTISQHVVVIMAEIDKVQKLSTEAKIGITFELRDLLAKIQRGAPLFDPLYPDTDLVTASVVKYKKSLKPADILDDPPSPYRFMDA